MYINPILLGIFGTLLVEFIAIFVVSLWRGKNENNDDEGNK